MDMLWLNPVVEIWIGRVLAPPRLRFMVKLGRMHFGLHPGYVPGVNLVGRVVAPTRLKTYEYF